MEIYNRLSSDIWAMNIPLAAKVIAERICALTKNGEKECFIANSYLVNLLKISEMTVQRALVVLQDTNIIRIKVTRKGDKKVRTGSITVVYPDSPGTCALRTIPLDDLPAYIEAGLK